MQVKIAFVIYALTWRYNLICYSKIHVPFGFSRSSEWIVTFLEISEIFTLNFEITKVNCFINILFFPFHSFQFWNDLKRKFQIWIRTNDWKHSNTSPVVIYFLLSISFIYCIWYTLAKNIALVFVQKCCTHTDDYKMNYPWNLQRLPRPKMNLFDEIECAEVQFHRGW